LDIRYFLGERLAFIEQLYINGTMPFVERKRKIEVGEDPFVPPYSEDPEPPFLVEWLEAEESLQAIGHMCVSMLSASFHLYFKTWERQLDIPVDDSFKSDFKKGWFNGYRAYFNRHFNVSFERSTCDLKLLEELVLARNRVQHPESITIHSSQYSQDDLKNIPSPFFIDERDSELLSKMGEGEQSWLLPPSIHVTQEKLMAAISEVAHFAEWLEQTDH
jgi:hypothetical protein